MAASALMNVMVGAARKAGRTLARDIGEVSQLQVSVKGPADYVTAADLRAEDIIFKELSRARQGYGFLMEERGPVAGADASHRWIVDALDGTTNFLHGLPQFSISIALEREGQLVAGMIYNPVTQETFTAEKGRGAFLNDRRIRVAGRRQISETIAVTNLSQRDGSGGRDAIVECAAVGQKIAGLRCFGSVALDLAWVAAGRFDICWHRGIKPWDMAAGIVILREAGAIVSDAEGGLSMFETGSILAGNPAMAKALSAVLAEARA